MKKDGNYWKIPNAQIREFENEIHKHGGIDYAALCIACLSSAKQKKYHEKLKATGQTTRQISKRWRESGQKS